MFSFKPEKLKTGQRIGGGAFGEIFPYQKIPGDNKWVVKVLKAKNNDLAHIMQEIVLGFGSRHPNLLAVKGFNLSYNEKEKEWDVYIKLPRMTQDLRSKVVEYTKANKKFSEEQIVKYFDNIISGLLYLHENNIAHRDVKLENILLDADGACKLADCGVGMFTEDEASYTVSENQVSRLYTAPEVLEGEIELKKKDLYKADAWSVGMAMLELCVLKTRLVDPFWSGQKKETELSKYINELNKDEFKNILKEVIQGLLKKDPNERKSIQEAQTILRAHYGNFIKSENSEKIEKSKKDIPEQSLTNELKSRISDLSLEIDRLKSIDLEAKIQSVLKEKLNEGLDLVPTETLRVCVTGAADEISYSFFPLLCSGTVFGPNVKIELRLLDIPAATKTLEGITLEIEDGAYPLLKNVKFGDNPREMFFGCDVVVFVGASPRKQGMERKELLQINAKRFREQGKALDEVAKKSVRCLVVGNPANTNCLVVQKNAPTIPKENFTCLTRLGQNRAVAQLVTASGYSVTDVKNIIIWGNNSMSQYPNVSHGTIQGKDIRNLVSNTYLNTEFISRVQKRGSEILNARGGASVFSVSNAVKDHLRDWYLGTKPGTYVSMGVVSDGSYGIPEGLVFSYPVTCEKFNYSIVKNLPWDPFSTEKIRITTQELVEERNEAELS